MGLRRAKTALVTHYCAGSVFRNVIILSLFGFVIYFLGKHNALPVQLDAKSARGKNADGKLAEYVHDNVESVLNRLWLNPAYQPSTGKAQEAEKEMEIIDVGNDTTTTNADGKEDIPDSQVSDTDSKIEISKQEKQENPVKVKDVTVGNKAVSIQETENAKKHQDINIEDQDVQTVEQYVSKDNQGVAKEDNDTTERDEDVQYKISNDDAESDTETTEHVNKKAESKPEKTKTNTIIINPHEFAYLINQPHACDVSPDIILYVHVRVDDLGRRDLIRQTWGQVREYNGTTFRTIFMVGFQPSLEIQKNLNAEANKYHDIVQEDFIDHYKNLTIKNIMGLKWVLNFCPKAKLIVKVDDDVVVNMFRLARFYQMMKLQGRLHDLLYCSNFKFHKEVPRTGKWAISTEQYAADVYPKYCQGFGYALTLDCAAMLYNASLYTPFLEIEDVFVTGVALQKTNITFTSFGNMTGYAYLNVHWKITRYAEIADRVGNQLLVLFRASNPDFFSILWPKVWNSYVHDYTAMKYLYAEEKEIEGEETNEKGLTKEQKEEQKKKQQKKEHKDAKVVKNEEQKDRKKKTIE